MLCLVKVALAWVAMMFIGTNLLGLVVRGLLSDGVPPKPPDDGSAVNTVLMRETRKLETSNLALTLLAVGASAAYYWVLFHYLGGALAVIAGAMMMISRLPDLVAEIRTGKQTTRESMSKTPLDYFMTILTWAALPVTWFALCFQQ